MDLLIQKDATISPCGTYRYRLTRQWSPEPKLTFIMLNPSTADADIDDPTIRRCMAFARREKAGGIIVVNLYAYRATDPKRLALHPEPLGPENWRHLAGVAERSRTSGLPLVCAWGAHPAASRGAREADRLRREGATLACLGVTQGGHPRHPLYVKGDQPFVPFPQTPGLADDTPPARKAELWSEGNAR